MELIRPVLGLENCSSTGGSLGSHSERLFNIPWYALEVNQIVHNSPANICGTFRRAFNELEFRDALMNPEAISIDIEQKRLMIQDCHYPESSSVASVQTGGLDHQTCHSENRIGIKFVVDH